MIEIRKLTKDEIQESGWKGWVDDHNLYHVTPQDAPQEQILARLAEESLETKQTAAYVEKGWAHTRVIGWGYTPKGYFHTQYAPRLWLICINGGTQ